jgi:hypothetical protein
MLPQISAHATGADEAPPATTIASLPRALLARVLARVPVDTRLRCCEVSVGWNDFLATERSLWTALDLSLGCDVTHTLTNALLRAVACKAGGVVRSLDVSHREISFAALLEAVTFNAGSLQELRLECRFDENWCFDDVTWSQVQALLRAAPRLQRLFTNVSCSLDEAPHVLANERASQPLRILKLSVTSPREDNGDDAAARAFAASLAAYASPLPEVRLHGVQLSTPGVLDAVVDGALVTRLVRVQFFDSALSPASAPSLARLLRGGGALLSFVVDDYEPGVQLLDARAAALLSDALRTNTQLRSLSLIAVRLWDDCDAAMTLLSSLVGHPSLRELYIDYNPIRTEHAAHAGAALSALVAADTPALLKLDVSKCYMGEAGLRRLFEALPRNSHLEQLFCSDNNSTSEAFARDVLLPAVRANTSLMSLYAADDREQTESSRAAHDIVHCRADDAGWGNIESWP